jgi:hypothetical protein
MVHDSIYCNCKGGREGIGNSQEPVPRPNPGRPTRNPVSILNRVILALHTHIRYMFQKSLNITFLLSDNCRVT